MNSTGNHLLFLKSALATEGFLNDTKDVLSWLKKENDRIKVNVEKTSFEKLEHWILDSNNIRHSSGKFFSIDGIRINTNWGEVKTWDQPIINQREVGYLGFIVKEFNGVLHFLVQAKIEPGNVNNVQLSPTLQATRSNYTKVHKGKAPSYLDYFKNATVDQIMFDQLQSEQGARFLKKRNRNIIIKVDEDIKQEENYIWLTLNQLKDLMSLDNVVNMDSRTVISCISFGSVDVTSLNILKLLRKKEANNFSFDFLVSSLTDKGTLHSMDSIFTKITHYKSSIELNVNKIPISEINQWKITEDEIVRHDERYFKIIAVDVAISNREVTKWSQPMVEPMNEGLCAFICKKINDVLHFAVQIKLECGNFDIIEFAPTVQTLTGDYKNPDDVIPFLDYILNIEKDKVIFDNLQSEEGGRFYREQNRNILVIAGDDFDIDVPDNFLWMTLHQLNLFIKHNNYINIQARNILAQIQYS